MASCGMLPVALGPLESGPAPSPATPPPPRRPRRRVLYPAARSRRPTLREAPDRALRGLLLLSALLFLQIYSEEAHSCAEVQGAEGGGGGGGGGGGAPAAPEPEGGFCSAERGRAVGEEPWRVQMVEPQVECVVA